MMDSPPEVVGIQTLAIVDHVCTVDENVLKAVLKGSEIGGSVRITMDGVREILANVGEFHSKAGGSAANTLRGLAAGFGVQCDVVGSRGQDEWGVMFVSSLRRASVNTDKLRVVTGETGRCVILSCEGERTMRTCLPEAVQFSADSLTENDLNGSKWAFFTGYCFYQKDLPTTILKMAKKAGVRVAIDLASFEVVRKYHDKIIDLLSTGCVDCCFCNEDEAVELIRGAGGGIDPEEGLKLLSKYCEIAVVTLGEKGCIFSRQGEEGIGSEPAAKGIKVVDATGAGDLFNSGFMYGLINGFPTHRCAQIGCLAGAAVVQTLGAELSATDWQWFHAQLHGELAATVVRDSAGIVHQELLGCYALIQKHGRGVVYYGSARLRESSPYWTRAVELGKGVAELLACTTWSGGGPGMMEAATRGAMEAARNVAGIRISREAGTTVRSACYLPESNHVVCRFLSPRKVALVDAGVRHRAEDRTAYIFLPGGLGTMDELFEIMTLMQLGKLGSELFVPLILCNFDGFYNGLMRFLMTCDEKGTVSAAEVSGLVVAQNNNQVLKYLAEFYGLEDSLDAEMKKDSTIVRASSWIEHAEQNGHKNGH